MTTVTQTLVRVKETVNKVVFTDQGGAGVAPVVDSIYVPKWWATSDVKTIKLTIEKP